MGDRRGLRRAGALFAALALALCATACSQSKQTSPPAQLPQVQPLVGLLHVVHPAGETAYLADAAGRQVELRGVALVGLEDIAYTNSGDGPPLYPINPADYDGKCPATSPLASQGPVCEVEADKPAAEQSAAAGSDDDFAEMRSLGMNVVRLVLDWSEIEPSPGYYSTEFIDRVAQVVGWAEAEGISVILDMHEDQYSRYILPGKKGLPSGCTPSGGYDGAPAWAVFTDGEPACEQYGESDLNPAVAAAFDNFWHNRRVPGAAGQSPGPGLQDEYIGAVAALARRFDHDPAVIGYELMNEPLPGAHSTVPLSNVVQFSTDELYPFYRRAIEALTGVRDGLKTCPASDPSGFVSNGPPPYPSTGKPCAYPSLGIDTHQLIFFEPCAYRNLLDFSPQHIGQFSSYDNLVFAPHIYTHAFTLDTFIGEPLSKSSYPPSFTFGYQTAISEARGMDAAVLTTEFGDNSGSDSTVLSNEIAAQDRTGIGGTLWAWSGLSSSEANCWCVRYQHSTYQTTSNGLPGKGDKSSVPGPAEFIASRVSLIAQPLPVATDGTLESWVSSPSSKSFAMVADTQAVATGPSEVEIPAQWSKASVTASGATVSVRRLAGGARLALIMPTATGRYEVVVAATKDGGAKARASALRDAASPLPPISYSSAYKSLQDFITSAEHSKDKTVASNASLVAVLANSVLGTSG